MLREHVRRGLATGCISGLFLAASLLGHVVVLAPQEIVDHPTPAWAVAGVVAAATLTTLPLFLLATIALALLQRRSGRAEERCGSWLRSLAVAVPLAVTGAADVAFGLFEGRTDAPAWIGALVAALAATGIGLAAGRATAGLPDGPPWWAWAVLAALLVAPALRLPPDRPARDAAVPSTDEAHGAPAPGVATGPRAAVAILITVDTLRSDHLSTFGYRRATTPRIDELARDALRFDGVLAASSCTVPSCAALLTGLEPWCSGVADQWSRLPAGAPTLAERFAAAGYRTVAVVSNPVLDARAGFAGGFDRFRNPAVAPPYPEARHVTRLALELVDEAPVPVFVWVHYMDPHYPYLPDDDALRAFLADGSGDDRSLPSIRYGSRGGLRLDRVLGTEDRGDALSFGEVVARYDAEIVSLDAGIGDLFDGLARRGLLDDAVIALTADHGEAMGEHGQVFDHCQETFDTTVRVPALFWAPGRLTPGHRPDPASHLDVPVTLLALAGVDGADDLPGVDLRGELDPARRRFTRSGLWDGLAVALLGRERLRPVRAVVHDGWKYVRYPHHELGLVRGPRSLVHAWRACLAGLWRPDGLFDLASDPGERHDRIDLEPVRAAALREMLRAHPSAADLARCPVPASAAQETEGIDETLRSLGYLD